jgi:hypothetical protein
MKLDSFTHAVLSNFSSINNSIVISEGTELRTMPENKTILAEATVPNNFDKTFGIYDLRKLLGCLSLTKDPEIKLEDKHLEISSGDNKIKYLYTEPSRIVSPSKRINLPSADVSFSLPSSILSDILKASQVLSVDDLCITSQNGEVTVTVMDKTDPTSNTASFSVTGSAKGTFKAFMKIANLKLITDDYEVKLSSKGISLFQSKNHDLKYYIAVESDSSFE